MPHRVDAAQRCADLLAALARTANVRLALQETGISAYWAYARRKADRDFEARWRTAVTAGRRALARAAAERARRGAGAGARAAVGAGLRLTLVGSSGKGTLRLARATAFSFTPERQETFLDALRATCCVKIAAEATGVSRTGAYRWYHTDAPFRARWDVALAEGRVHLEMALIGAARALVEGPYELTRPEGVEGPYALARPDGVEEASVPVDAECAAVPVVSAADVSGMDAKVALQVLKLHSPRDVRGRMRGRWVKAADVEETRAEILAKVAAVKAAREG